MRYVYSWHKTRAKAEDVLESYFAEGLVCEGEHPLIEKRKGWYAITLPEWTSPC